MKKLLVSTFILFTTLFPQKTLGKGKLFYDHRAQGRDGLTASTKSIDEAIKQFNIVLSEDSHSLEAAVYLLRSYYFRAEYATQNIEEKKQYFDKGKALGLEYIAKHPENIDFRYWYLANLGGWAKVYGILTAAREGVADQMKEHAEKIISLDSDYRNGGGYYLLGAVHYKSPYIPFLLSWPDNDEAIKLLTKAVETGKPLASQQIYLAQALHKDGQVDKAKSLLESVINSEPDPEELIEDLNYIQEAKDLLKDM